MQLIYIPLLITYIQTMELFIDIPNHKTCSYPIAKKNYRMSINYFTHHTYLNYENCLVSQNINRNLSPSPVM